MCSGKIYYDLIEARENYKNNKVTSRIEQLYPFPVKTLANILKDTPKLIFMVSRRTNEYGGMEYGKKLYGRTLEMVNYGDKSVKYVGRKAASSTATGNLNKHLAQQKEILEKILKD